MSVSDDGCVGDKWFEREDVHPEPPVLQVLRQLEVLVVVSSAGDVMVQVIPIVVLQLLHVDVDPRDLVPVVVRGLQIGSLIGRAAGLGQASRFSGCCQRPMSTKIS